MSLSDGIGFDIREVKENCIDDGFQICFPLVHSIYNG